METCPCEAGGRFGNRSRHHEIAAEMGSGLGAPLAKRKCGKAESGNGDLLELRCSKNGGAWPRRRYGGMRAAVTDRGYKAGGFGESNLRLAGWLGAGPCSPLCALEM